MWRTSTKKQSKPSRAAMRTHKQALHLREIKRFTKSAGGHWSEENHRSWGYFLLQFHAWMDEQNITPMELDQERIESFIRCPAGRELAKSSRKTYRTKTRCYLRWLYAQGKLPKPA